jgi:hypothetical protein
VTHNYVDIMSRIYVDSTPRPTGSTRAAGLKVGEKRWRGAAYRVHRRRCLMWAPISANRQLLAACI